MNLSPASLNRLTIGPHALVVLAGVVAGTLDLAYASTSWGLQRGLPPLQILQSVAAGWLGRATIEGGDPSALLGPVSHDGLEIKLAPAWRIASRTGPSQAPPPTPAGN